MTSRKLALAAVCAALAAGCKESSRGTAMRLVPIEATTVGGADAAKLTDMDTTTAAAIDTPTRLSLRFARPVAVTRLKIHGARSVAVTGDRVSGFGAEDESGWASAEVSGGRVLALTLELAPKGPGASLGEIEVWGEGERRGDADPHVLADRSRRPPTVAAAARTDRTRWVADDVLAIAATPDAATLRPRGTTEGEDCVRLRFEGGAAVRGARRAYLAYEANLHRAVELTRSVAGGAPSEALWLGAAPRAQTIVDEIDPRRLTGVDEVLLCLPIEATDAVTLEDVRLVLVADSGANGFDRDARLVLGAAADGDASTSAMLAAGRVELGLDRLVALDRASIRLAAGSAVLESVGTFDGTAWTEQKNVPLSGVTPLEVTGRRARALALAFAGSPPSIAEVEVAGSGIGPRVGAPRIVIAYPKLARSSGGLVGERFGDDAFVAGWAESPAGAGTVEIEGAAVGVDGAFGVALKRPAIEGSWTVRVRARFPDGSEAVKVIHLDDDRSAEIAPTADASLAAADDARFGIEDQTEWRTLTAKGGQVKLGTDVTLEIPEGALANDTRIGIARKGPEVMPKLDAGMVNVTAPAHFAYRFLPAGQRFAKPVKLTLPYDPELLPEGMLPEEIQTYYYDDVERRWLTLPRVAVRRDTRSIVSETTHFTFMINAVLVLPDHPGPVSFNPTSIKDLKAADPSAGIDLVEPPTGNGQGTANLSFPIRLPNARGAYQPSFAIAYDSGNPGGWLGVGWDLPVSSISIDTRYGVPLYDGEERYLLDGAQLVPVELEATCSDGKAGRRYMARVERDFRRIVRCGEDTTRYWFEVTDKAGTFFVYGNDSNARLTSYVPHMFAIPRYPPAYDVGQWFLERVVDANENLTEYVYQHDDRGSALSGIYSEDFRQVYLADVYYTGRAARTATSLPARGPYHVQFAHRASLRGDVATLGRLGFKVMTRKLLSSILVEFKGERIREYALEYEVGDFGKTRLEKLKVKGADGSDFYEHRFGYTNKEVRDTSGAVAAFAPVTAWDGPGSDDEAALTSSSDTGFGGHGFVGISLEELKDSGCVGFALDVNQRNSKTDATFLDVNGDGLPDRMFRQGGALLNRPASEILGPALSSIARPGDPAVPGEGPAFHLENPQSLGSETSHVWSGAVQLMGYGIDASLGGSYSTTRSSEMVIDANGDGLPDLLSNGQVWFNQPRCTGQGDGKCFQEGIPAPKHLEKQLEVAFEPANPEAGALRSRDETRRDSLAPEDVVLEWTAPFDGLVDVTGGLAFSDQVIRSGRRDGVRLRMSYLRPSLPFVVADKPKRVEIGTPTFWTQLGQDLVKFPDDATVSHVAQRVRVARGDVLHFVLSTLSDFPVGTRADGKTRYSAEEVGFAPVITYFEVGPEDRSVFVDEQMRDAADVTGTSLYRYDSAEDFRLAGNQQLAVAVPRAGRLQIATTLNKKPTGDDIVACARYFEPGTYDPAKAECDPHDPAGTPLHVVLASGEDSTTYPSLQKDVEAGGTFVFWIRSALPVDPGQVDWQIEGEMTCIRTTGRCEAPTEEERRQLHFRATPNHPVHVNADVMPQFETYKTWLPAENALVPFVPPADGTLFFDVDEAVFIPPNFPRSQWEADVQDHLANPYTFAVRSPDKLHASWKLPVRDASGRLQTRLQDSRAIPVKKGVPVFFEAHGEKAFVVQFSVGAVWFQEDGSTDRVLVTGSSRPVAAVTTCATNVRYKLGNVPLLGGGYRGWRYGAWHGTNDEAFLPWVYRSPPDSQVPRYPDQDEDNKDILKEFYRAVLPPYFKARQNIQRTRARTLGLLVPSVDGTRRTADEPGLEPGVPAWVSADGSAYVTAGGMNAARRGARVNGPNDLQTIPAYVDFGSASRESVSTTVTGGVQLSVASMSLSAGMSHQQEDLVDLNGDRIPDVLESSGVPDLADLATGDLAGFLADRGSASALLLDPVSMSPRNQLSIPVQPRLTVDVGAQAGLGLTEAVKLRTAKNDVRAVAARLPYLSGGVGIGMNLSTTVQDLVDVNGDGLPDAVRKNDACGGFSVRLNLGNAFARGEDCLPRPGAPLGDLSGLARALDPSRAQSNPDGGEDFEKTSGMARTIVGQANTASAIKQTSTVTLQGNLGGGVSSVAIDRTESYGASVTSESSLSSTNVMFVDVTGDGLPDYVTKSNTSSQFLVAVNNGYGFYAPQPWNAPPWPPGWKPNFESGSGSYATLEGLATSFWSRASDGIDPVEATGTHTKLPSTSFVFTISFPLTPVLVPWMQLSFGANATLGRETGFELGMQDIDGDGLPDHVLKKRGKASVRARVNQLGGANMLNHVTRPLRGSFEIEYARVGNTVDMPESRWTLAKVTVHDGVASGTGHDLATSYRYEGGYYHRNEREFLGFRTMTRKNGDGSKIVQSFDNEDYLYKGLVRIEVVLDENDHKLVETENGFVPQAAGDAVRACLDRTPLNLQYPDGPLYCEARFPKLAWTEKRLYEGLDAAAMISHQEFRYDGHGNVTFFHDHGDVKDPDDDVFAFVSYRSENAPGVRCVGAPAGIVVTAVEDPKASPLRKRWAEYDDRCNLTYLHAYVGGTEAVTTLEYYDSTDAAFGNLKRITSPPNHLGDRYHVQYAYDSDVHTYVTRTEDVHGYVSEAAFFPKFGENWWTKDVNGQKTERALDEFGRVRRVAAPGFTLEQPTIDITYGHAEPVPWALTKNRLPSGGTLDTVVFMDGVGRVIQTKKTAEVWTGVGENTKVGWAVSGRQRFDVMGRVAEQGQTFYGGGLGTGYLPGTPLNPTVMVYDALGRTVRTTEPNGAVTQLSFGFGTPAGKAFVQHKITTTDPQQKVRVAYQDVAERTSAVEEHVEGRTPTTHYDHDRLGQLVIVTDAAGIATRVAYDELGRRTRLENLDTGTTIFGFDLAGNLTSRKDAKAIVTAYVYDFERLKEVHYATARRNVVYEYGAPGAPENGAARITRVDDEVGEETRGYDELGNLARSTRTIDPLRPGDRTRAFTTSFDFDVFGRMLSIVYPDGEVLKYGYDAGGLLRTAVGNRPATKYDPAQSETYLATLLYDEFGQRRYQRVGNGVVTKYEYEPLTRRLSWLHAQKPGERLLQNLTYSYDLVGNVLGVKNTLGEPDPSRAGTVEFAYRYDDLHRLVWASGSAKSRPRTIDTFTSTFAYSDIHNMTANVQVHRILHGGGPGEFPPHTNHDLSYRYEGAGPHQATRIGDAWLVYDKNGNTETECRDPADSTCKQRPAHLRRYDWTEENRLDAVIDGGGKNVTKFLYDAGGERIAKLGRGGESITIGQFWALKGRRAATKHVFAGTTRLASKLLPPPGWDDVPRGTETTTAVTVTDGENGCVPSNYQPQKCQVLPGGEPVLNDYYAYAKVRPETYYYHPDHLGSTSWVTDQNARPHEHVEYFPYGAVWRDPRSDLGASPVKGQRFLFTGKELDEETGLYYFGARYYDPVWARWTSPDPALDKYLPGVGDLDGSRLAAGGVFNPINLAVYHHSRLNPLKYVDPNGLWGAPVHRDDTKKWAVQSGFAREQAEIIGNAANAVDDIGGGRSYLPILGDQSYHFNTNWFSGDSRTEKHEYHFNRAVEHGRRAADLRQKATDLRKRGTSDADVYELMAWMEETSAMRELGTSIHPLQDRDAHVAPYVKSNGLYLYHDSPELNGKPNLADDPTVAPERYQNTERATKDAFRRYQEAVKTPKD